jgi:hypothetical protein
MSADDGDALLVPKCEQVTIAAHDEVDPAGHGGSDVVVVIGIARHDSWNFDGLNQIHDRLVVSHRSL